MIYMAVRHSNIPSINCIWHPPLQLYTDILCHMPRQTQNEVAEYGKHYICQHTLTAYTCMHTLKLTHFVLNMAPRRPYITEKSVHSTTNAYQKRQIYIIIISPALACNVKGMERFYISQPLLLILQTPHHAAIALIKSVTS